MKKILIIGSIIALFLAAGNVYANQFHHPQEECTYDNCPYYEKALETKEDNSETTYHSCGMGGCYHSDRYGCSGMNHASRGHHHR